MKKLLIAMTMTCAMAMAQTGSTSSGSTSSTSGDQTASKSETKKTSAETAGGKEKSVTGCLHKDGDNYWLATKTTKYHVMSSQDLSAHDGHEVKVSGKTSKAPMPGATDNKKVNHLEASNVEMVSDKCAMGTKSMKMSGEELSKQPEPPKK
jgi:uncharacterized protein YdeI (BOF family)